jgi:DNA-directed RNA polymerase specialized sigma24 family protein
MAGTATGVPVTAVPAAQRTIRDPEGKQLVERCLAGDTAARTRFQDSFGPLIYRFADYLHRDRIEPGDFYVYLFENDRLYWRLASYKGEATLTAFLRGYALPDLFRQFESRMRRRTLDTVSLDTDHVREPSAGLDAAESTPLGAAPQPGQPPSLSARLSDDRRLLLKLLYVLDFDLAPDDVQLLVRRSGRSVQEAIELVEQARESVRLREVEKRRMIGQAESAAQWILRYDRRLAQVAEDLAHAPPHSERAVRLQEEQNELERKRAWRNDQRTRALDEAERATVTLRYREIAELLNVPLGTVSAEITRMRQDLLKLAEEEGGLSGRRTRR